MTPYSVLLPVAPWEQPTCLERCLVSVYRQQLLPQDVVVSIDGQLPEAFAPILNRFSSGYPAIALTIIEGQSSFDKPSGVGPTLQRGLEHCQCDLVMRLDADDSALPQRALRQLLYLQSHPDVAILGSWMAEFNGVGVANSVRAVPIEAEAIQRAARWRNPVNHPSVMFRKAAIEAVGGYADCAGFEDYLLWLRLLKRRFLIENLPECLTTASAGEALLARRHGFAYARRELAFLLCCGREQLMPWSQVWLLLLLRLPLRLLPRAFLAHLMRLLLRQPG